MLLGLA